MIYLRGPCNIAVHKVKLYYQDVNSARIILPFQRHLEWWFVVDFGIQQKPVETCRFSTGLMTSGQLDIVRSAHHFGNVYIVQRDTQCSCTD